MDLSNNQLSGAISKRISSLGGSLHLLDLSQNNITKLPGRHGIGKLRNLEEFYFRANKVKKIPSSLVEIPSLMMLDVSDNNLKSIPEVLIEVMKRRTGFVFVGMGNRFDNDSIQEMMRSSPKTMTGSLSTMSLVNLPGVRTPYGTLTQPITSSDMNTVLNPGQQSNKNLNQSNQNQYKFE